MAVDTSIAMPGSYQQYKSDTAAFLTWLLRAAQAYGYTYSAPRKGIAKEVEIEIKNCKVPVREILEQARIVCTGTSSLCTIPKKVATLAERAIAARQQFTAQFKELPMQGAESEASTDAHEHFTRILCKTLKALKEHANEYPREPVARPSTAKSTSESPTDVTEVQNVFIHLEVEDCEEADWALHVPPQPQETKQSDTANAKPGDGFDIAPFFGHIDRREIAMQVGCFFRDIEVLRLQVLDLWIMYKSGKVDLIAVTMATNAAISIAGQMDRDFLDYLHTTYDPKEFEAAPYLGLDSAYSEITGVGISAILNRGCLVFDPASAFGPKGHYWFSDIAIILSKFGCAMAARRAENLTTRGLCGPYPPPKEKCYDWSVIFPRVETLEMSFLTMSTEPDLAFEDRDFQDLKKLDKFLTSILIDIVLRHETMDYAEDHFSASRAFPPDELSRSILALERGDGFGAAAILGCSILRDLHDLLGDKRTKPYDLMCAEMNKSWNSVKYAKVDYEKLETTKELLWPKSDRAHLTVIEQARTAVLDEHGYWAKHQRNIYEGSPRRFYLRRTDVQVAQHLSWLDPVDVDTDKRNSRIANLKDGQFMLPASVHALRFWHSNPLACGTMMYNFKLAREQAGVCLANAHLAIVHAAYLYTALNVGGHLKGRWKDMDDIIESHKSAMFFGAMPADPSRAHGMWVMRHGFNDFLYKSQGSAWVQMVIGGDRTGKLPLKKAQGACLSISDTSHQLGQVLAGEESMIRVVHAIGKDMVRKGYEAPGKRNKVALNNPDFLFDFAQHVSADCANMKDYITMTKTCHAFLIAFNRAYRNDILGKGKQPPIIWGQKPGKPYYSQGWKSKQVHIQIFCSIDSLLGAERARWENNKKLEKLKKQFGGDVDYDLMAQVGSFVQKYLDQRKMLVHEETKKAAPKKAKQAEVKSLNAVEALAITTFRAMVEEAFDEEFGTEPADTW